MLNLCFVYLFYKKNLKHENVATCYISFLNLLYLLREEYTDGIWEKGAEHHTFGRSYSKYQMDGQNQVRSIIIFTLDEVLSRSRWPWGLTCVSASARVVGLRVRITLETWMSVSCECCVVSQRSLRRTDPSSRGVQPSVRAYMCACVTACD